MQKDETKSDVIEIPVGKYLSGLRDNPWRVSSVVLGVVLLGVLLFTPFSGTGSTISSAEAGENVLSFINSNPDLEGEVTIDSVGEEDGFHKVILNYGGQQVPIYLTLDGRFLLAGRPVPLDSIPTNQQANQQINAPTQNLNDGSSISEDDDAFLGNENAPVTIIEFSDYQCPYCRKFWSETLPLIKSEYIDGGKVKLVYRDYPLPGHAMAQPSAEAAECVRAKGGNSAYFEYHDVLFSNQQLLSSENLKKWALEIGYDISDCMESEQFKSEVLADFNDGGSLGTPTFFVNGIKVEGAQPFSVFKQVVDSQLI